MARSSAFSIDGSTALITCSAEDLVVLKVFAGRMQDSLDVAGIVVRQGVRSDRALVLQELRPLLELKEETEGESRLQHLFAKHPTPGAR